MLGIQAVIKGGFSKVNIKLSQRTAEDRQKSQLRGQLIAFVPMLYCHRQLRLHPTPNKVKEEMHLLAVVVSQVASAHQAQTAPVVLHRLHQAGRKCSKVEARCHCQPRLT